MVDYKKLSSKYIVRKLKEEDIDIILALCVTNPDYYDYCPPNPSRESIKRDMNALPPNKTLEDKYYIGFFKEETLIALMDLIEDFPEKRIAFIGLFMLNSKYSNKGIGYQIINELERQLNLQGFKSIVLGYMKENPQSKAFWEKCKFTPTGVETNNGQGMVVIMKKEI